LNLILNQENYDAMFKGFQITDCVVRKKDLVYFVLQPIEEEAREDEVLQTRLIQCVERQGLQPWGNQPLPHFSKFLAGVSHSPTEQFVGVSSTGFVFATGSGDAGVEDDLKGVHSRQLQAANAPRDAFLLRGGISKLRTIAGRVWGVGGGRTVIDRVGKNNWNYHTSLPKPTSFLDPDGFEDIDGFAEDDIYAVGGDGDVWHFDGKKWRQVSFPSNMQLESICCAGDGHVYIGAESGSVFKGRGNTWKLIERGNMALPFRDMVWFQDAVWCTSDYGLWNIRKDSVLPADVPSTVKVCAGNLSVGDGVMLLAGVYGAAIHDGTAWRRMIDYNGIK
jgi:hypothetical protein